MNGTLEYGYCRWRKLATRTQNRDVTICLFHSSLHRAQNLSQILRFPQNISSFPFILTRSICSIPYFCLHASFDAPLSWAAAALGFRYRRCLISVWGGWCLVQGLKVGVFRPSLFAFGRRFSQLERSSATIPMLISMRCSRRPIWTPTRRRKNSSTKVILHIQNVYIFFLLSSQMFSSVLSVVKECSNNAILGDNHHGFCYFWWVLTGITENRSEVLIK